jgi:DNA-binding transcriptional ArsR family regulator
MTQPFEGLFGDTCETRLLQFLLPMYGIEFDMAELVDEIGLTRQSIAKAMNKFAARGMVKIRKEGRTPLYSINGDSPLVKCLEDFDNSLIEAMVGEKEFSKMEKTYEKSNHAQEKKGIGTRSRSIVVRNNAPRDVLPCVASRTSPYGK